MEPATHAAVFEDPPGDLLERLRPVLAAQGSPVITATQQNGRFVFSCVTAELVLRSRVSDALTAVWPDWRPQLRSHG